MNARLSRESKSTSTVISVRVSPHSYFAALLISTFFAGLIFYLGYRYSAAVLFVLACLIFPFLAFTDRLAFDGTNVWIANGGIGKVTVLNAGTGAPVDVYDVGEAPYAVTFDGTYMWVSNVLSNNVMKLDKNTGAILATYNLGAHPRAVVFDPRSPHPDRSSRDFREDRGPSMMKKVTRDSVQDHSGNKSIGPNLFSYIELTARVKETAIASVMD